MRRRALTGRNGPAERARRAPRAAFADGIAPVGGGEAAAEAPGRRGAGGAASGRAADAADLTRMRPTRIVDAGCAPVMRIWQLLWQAAQTEGIVAAAAAVLSHIAPADGPKCSRGLPAGGAACQPARPKRAVHRSGRGVAGPRAPATLRRKSGKRLCQRATGTPFQC